MTFYSVRGLSGLKLRPLDLLDLSLPIHLLHTRHGELLTDEIFLCSVLPTALLIDTKDVFLLSLLLPHSLSQAEDLKFPTLEQCVSLL